MKSPFYKVYIGNRDISELIERFKFEDSIEKDNMLEIVMYQKVSQQLADDDDFSTGSVLTFHFGFMAGKISRVHTCRISDITHSYKEKVTMTVIGLDAGNVAKKVKSKKVWKNRTSSQIVQEIAFKYSLGVDINPTDKVWDEIPQADRSDLEFIRYLAEREGDGDMVAYIRSQELAFKKRSIKTKPSTITFTYGDGDGSVVSFTPSIKESSQKGESNVAVTATFDPYTGEYTTEVVDNSSESATGTLGKYEKKYIYDRTPKKVGETVEINENIDKPTDSKQESITLANSMKKKAKMDAMPAKLVVKGNPLLVPDTIITMRNVAKRHAGNWYVVSVRHDITSSGYLTTLDLKKNGSNVGDEAAKDSNDSIGDTEIEDKTPIRVFNGEQEFLGMSTVEDRAAQERARKLKEEQEIRERNGR